MFLYRWPWRSSKSQKRLHPSWMSLSAALGLWRTRAGSSRTSAGLGRRTHNPVRWAPACSTPAGWRVHLWDPNTEEWHLVQAPLGALCPEKRKRRKTPKTLTACYIAHHGHALCRRTRWTPFLPLILQQTVTTWDLWQQHYGSQQVLNCSWVVAGRRSKFTVSQ